MCPHAPKSHPNPTRLSGPLLPSQVLLPRSISGRRSHCLSLQMLPQDQMPSGFCTARDTCTPACSSKGRGRGQGLCYSAAHRVSGPSSGRCPQPACQTRAHAHVPDVSHLHPRYCRGYDHEPCHQQNDDAAAAEGPQQGYGGQLPTQSREEADHGHRDSIVGLQRAQLVVHEAGRKGSELHTVIGARSSQP